jgi:hypothetical protein
MGKSTLGYLEKITLPDLGIQCDAKVDTGAFSSSLHADQIELFEKEGMEWIRFQVHFNRKHIRIDQICEALLLTRKKVASSNGQSSYRYVISTNIILDGQTWAINISLTHRGSMNYPMLLGRDAIRGRFVVDVEHTYLSQR